MGLGVNKAATLIRYEACLWRIRCHFRTRVLLPLLIRCSANARLCRYQGYGAPLTTFLQAPNRALEAHSVQLLVSWRVKLHLDKVD
jgi:hypothetical protein